MSRSSSRFGIPSLLPYLTLLLSPAQAHAAWPTDPGVNLPVCSAAGTQSWPDAISDLDGGFFVAWQDARDPSTGFDIYVQHVGADGVPSWTPNGVAACTAPADQVFMYNRHRPQMAPDGLGGVIVAWEDARNGNRDVFAQRIDASGNPTWTANGVAVCTESLSQGSPLVLADGAGGAIVVWEDFRQVTGGIYAQRLDAAGVPRWTANGRAVCTTPVAQNHSAISDGVGGAIVAWEDYRNCCENGDEGDVYVQRISGSGVRQWSANGYPVAIGPGRQQTPFVLSDGAGGAMIFWSDDRAADGDFDVYAQRIDDLGSPQWTPNGVSLCVASQWQYGPAAALDATGGAILSWEDQRPFPNVYGQRVDPSGASQWTGSGLLLNTLARIASVPGLVPDAVGGAFLAVTDSRNFPPDTADIYATRIDATGAPLWGAAGVAVSTAAGPQYLGDLLPGALGGVIAVWEDHRDDGGDIYAQYVGPQGTLGGPVAAVPGAAARPISLHLRSANPATAGMLLGFGLPAESTVHLALYDVGGRRVRELVSGSRGPGLHEVRWDGRDDSGRLLAAGLYFATLQAEGYRRAVRLALVR